MIPSSGIDIVRSYPDLSAGLISGLGTMADPATLISESLYYLPIPYIDSGMVQVVQQDVSCLQLGGRRKDLPSGTLEAVSHIAGVGGTIGIGASAGIAVKHQG